MTSRYRLFKRKTSSLQFCVALELTQYLHKDWCIIEGDLYVNIAVTESEVKIVLFI